MKLDQALISNSGLIGISFYWSTSMFRVKKTEGSMQAGFDWRQAGLPVAVRVAIPG
jgi:hypothetical protein